MKIIKAIEFRTLYERIRADKTEEQRYLNLNVTEKPVYSSTGSYKGTERIFNGFPLQQMLKDHDYTPDLSGLDLSNIDFNFTDFDSIDLSYSNLYGCDLSASNFHRCKLNCTNLKATQTINCENLETVTNNGKIKEINYEEFEKIRKTRPKQTSLFVFFGAAPTKQSVQPTTHLTVKQEPPTPF